MLGAEDARIGRSAEQAPLLYVLRRNVRDVVERARRGGVMDDDASGRRTELARRLRSVERFDAGVRVPGATFDPYPRRG